MISKMNGESFDLDTFNELWDQCKQNSKGEVKVAEFMEYVRKAEEILMVSLKQLESIHDAI